MRRVLRVEQRRDEDFLDVSRGRRSRHVAPRAAGDRHPRRLAGDPGHRDARTACNAHVCPDCDGYDARDKKVVVIGNGRRAVGMALNLTTWTREIIICTNGRPPELDEPEYCTKLDALNIPVLTEAITRVTTDSRHIHCLAFENGMQLDAEKIFFTIGQYPADDLGVQLGCERDDEGRIVIDRHGNTSVTNVFAAGDITSGSPASDRGGRRRGDRRAGDSQIARSRGATAHTARRRYQFTVTLRGFLSRTTSSTTVRSARRTLRIS